MDTIEQETGKRAQSEIEEIDAVGPRKRRRHSATFKRRVVEEALTGAESVSVVARRHDINANMLFNWRKQYLSGGFDEPAGSPLIPITVSPGAEAASSLPDPESTGTQTGPDRLKIALSGGHRVVVEGSMSAATLRTVLEVLTR